MTHKYIGSQIKKLIGNRYFEYNMQVGITSINSGVATTSDSWTFEIFGHL